MRARNSSIYNCRMLQIQARCSCRKEKKSAERCECVNSCNRSSLQPLEDDNLLHVSVEERLRKESPDQQLTREVEETTQMVFGVADLTYLDYSDDNEMDESI